MTLRITRFTAIEAGIALKHEIKHASHKRTANQTLLVRCELSDGSIGWGEGLPRPYVTGETIDTAWSHVEAARQTIGASVDELPDCIPLIDSLRMEGGDRRDCFGNATRCAIELSLLDAVGRATQRSVSDLVGELIADAGPPQPVIYSAVLPASSTVKKAIYRAVRMRLFGIRDVKVKLAVAGYDDERTLRLYQRWIGGHIRTADANEGWTADELATKCDLLQRHGLTACEQPIPHDQIKQLDGWRSREADTGVRLMLDESFCSAVDLEDSLAADRASLFNLRLSKCGGLIASCRLMNTIAADESLGMQLGCQVGETAILSAAGRAVASRVRGLRATEGSYDRFLVAEPLSEDDITFGRGGVGPPLGGPGLGITIDTEAVARVTRRSKTIDAAR